MPSELDIEEIAKASLMVVESDEKSPAANEKVGGSNNGPSYLLVSKEALATEDPKETGKWGLMGFLDARFIGRNCAIMMFLW